MDIIAQTHGQLRKKLGEEELPKTKLWFKSRRRRQSQPSQTKQSNGMNIKIKTYDQKKLKRESSKEGGGVGGDHRTADLDGCLEFEEVRLREEDLTGGQA